MGKICLLFPPYIIPLPLSKLDFLWKSLPTCPRVQKQLKLVQRTLYLKHKTQPTCYFLGQPKCWQKYFFTFVNNGCSIHPWEKLRLFDQNPFVRFLWKLVIPGLIGRINEAETLTLRQNGLPRNT